MICVKLLFINDRKERYWLARVGYDDRDANRLLVRLTTQDRDRAKCFASGIDAADMLLKIGNPVGWEIVVEDPDANGK